MTSFKLPENYSTPEGIKEGQTFKEIVTFKVLKGQLSIVSIGENEIPLTSGKPKNTKQALDEALQNANVDDDEGSGDQDQTAQ